MLISQVDSEVTKPTRMRNEADDLENRLVRLSEASIRISGSPDTAAALQEVVDSA